MELPCSFELIQIGHSVCVHCGNYSYHVLNKKWKNYSSKGNKIFPLKIDLNIWKLRNTTRSHTESPLPLSEWCKISPSLESGK